MKRLVDYDSDDDTPAPQKRKLPALSASLSVPVPVDDPALHQGRVRAVPHVDGQYAAYVYVPLDLHPSDPLHALVEAAVALAQTHVPSLHPIGQGPGHKWALHISLSRPLFLRAHQRDDFKRAVRWAASSVAPFDASFTSFSELANDERTRTFLALDLGAGHGELSHCLALLGPSLRQLRQNEFYLDPKFHASIAWALMAGDTASEEQAPTEIEQPSDGLVRIPRFPPTLVPSLNEAYAAKLSQARTGGFLVDRISTKIGKDVFTWPLDGAKQIGN